MGRRGTPGDLSVRILKSSGKSIPSVAFTEYTTIAILPVLLGKSSFRSLARLWTLVYLGNLSGGAAFAVAMVYIAPALEVAPAESFGRIAADLIRPDPQVMVLSAILAGWLMGLLSWLIAAARDTVSQIVFVWIVAGTIGLGHLHHSIVGAIEVFAGFLATDLIGPADCFSFLLWVTLGNAIGGAVFAVFIRYSVVVGKTQ